MDKYKLFAGPTLSGIHLQLGDGSVESDGLLLSKEHLIYDELNKKCIFDVNGVTMTENDTKSTIDSIHTSFNTVDSNGNTLTETTLSPNSVSLYDGTNLTTLTATSISSTGTIAITNASLNGIATGITPDPSDDSIKLATTAFVKSQNYITSLSNSLSGYATIASLSSYVTNSSLLSSLSSYATIASLSSYATIASLSSYVTNSSLSSSLSSYATIASLSSYVTNSSLSSSLSSYATIASLSSYATLLANQSWDFIQTFKTGIVTNSIKSTTIDTSLTIGYNLSGGSITLGGSQTTGEIIIGPTAKINQKLKVGTGTIENVIGNTSTITSYSTTFNKKISATNTAINLYEILFPTASAGYLIQYFELVISGSNSYVGAYCYKYSFMIFCGVSGNTPSIINQTTISGYNPPSNVGNGYNGNAGVLSFVNTINKSVIQYNSPSAGRGQSFTSTLIAFPTSDNLAGLYDFSITAL